MRPIVALLLLAAVPVSAALPAAAAATEAHEPAAVRATDGRAVASTWTPPAKGSAAPAPAAVLIAQDGVARSEWQPLAARLADVGVGALAVDIRTAKKDPAESAPDVLGAIDWLRKQKGIDPARIFLVGAGTRGLAALVSAAADAKVKGLALVSVPLKQGDFDGEAALGTYGPRPVFVVVGRGDKIAARAALVLDGSAQGPHKMFIAQNGGRGATLVIGDPEALEALVVWIQQVARGEPAPNRDPPVTPVDPGP